MNRYRWFRLILVLCMISGGYYVFNLFENGIITEKQQSYFICMILAGFLLLDLVTTLISKETIIYFYGATKKDNLNLYRFWLCFEIVMVIVVLLVMIK